MAARVFLSLLALLATTSLALPTISAKGAKFFTSDGNQFFVKGVAYQLTPDDPLVSTEQCQRDAKLMQTLGANSIRVYHVDPSANHDGCMKAFSDVGIYAWIDLDTFSTYILGPKPYWTKQMASAYEEVMDTFQGYDNVAGFFVGNEVLTKGSESGAAPFVKAAARDMKAYRDGKGYRKIPIGYSAADIAELRPNLQNYMACGDDAADRLDFFSLNAYEWCGDSSYQTSGYSQLQQNATDYNIPIFFSETGCNTPQPRNFADQAAIFGSQMSGTWSGAIIYEWIEEANNYGLITYGPPADSNVNQGNVVDGFTRSGTPTPKLPDFTNLSKQWAAVSPSSISANAYNPKLTAPPCPAFTSGLWVVSEGATLPSASEGTPIAKTPAAAVASGNNAQQTTTTTTSASAASTAPSSPSGSAVSSTSHSAAANRLAAPFLHREL